MSDKKATLELLDKEYEGLCDAIDGLNDEQLSRVWFGTWAVRDMVAHVLGWEREMTGALQRLARGERPAREGADYSKFDEWNAGFASAMKPISTPTILATWRQVHANYVRAAGTVPDDRYGEGDDGKPKTANRLLEASGFGHYRQHGADIREWRTREGL